MSEKPPSFGWFFGGKNSPESRIARSRTLAWESEMTRPRAGSTAGGCPRGWRDVVALAVAVYTA